MDDDPNTFRFFLTTDNHLGYMEKDPRRGKDAFVTFEECLREAVLRKVDAVLLSGDLFHENKPTLGTLQRTMTLMKRYVMGDAPVRFSLLSDPKVNFPRHPVHLANFQDPNVNIALPIFAIHGNHDDIVGGFGALDILASSSLVNYFGASESVDDIVLRPILLQKGTTRIALYGLGSVRDERLHRAFVHRKVRFVRPKEGEWFTILLFHQNRGVRSSTNKNGIYPEMLQGYGLDLVIWGNEHEQRMVPEDAGGYEIVQPGSSILTQLTASESNPKQYGVLEVRGSMYRVTGYPLKSCRPVVYRTVALCTENPNGRSVAAVEEYLHRVADEMIDEAQQLIQHIPAEVINYHPNVKFPLMRLSVDFHDPDSPIGANYPIPNVNRFGQRFLDAVANASEMLKPINDKQRRRRLQEHVDLEAHEAVPQNIPVTDIRVKLATALASNTRDSCQLLSEPQVANAIYSYVEKGEKGAISETSAALLKTAQKHVWKVVNQANGGPGGGGANGAPANGAPPALEAQLVADVAFSHKQGVNKLFTEAEQQEAQRPTMRASVDFVQDVIRRGLQHEDAAGGVGGAAGGLPAAGNLPQPATARGQAHVVSVDDDDDVMPAGQAHAPAPAAKKSAARRPRGAPTEGAEPKPPAARGRKKEVAAVASSQNRAPALQMGGAATSNGNDDLLANWNM